MVDRRRTDSRRHKHGGTARADKATNKDKTAARRRHSSNAAPIVCGDSRLSRSPSASQETTIFTGPVYAYHVSTRTQQPGRDEAEQVAQWLQQILEHLRDAGMERSAENAVREATNRALAEANQPSPQPRRLRRGIAEVTEAILTGVASGASSEALKHLVLMLQHVV